MCNKRNSKRMCIEGRVIKVDECISDEIYKWLMIGYITLGSCCGHGIYPQTIVLKNGSSGLVVPQGIVIERKKRFYRKDEQGYYYIPETINKKKEKN